jgi:hypothetical protein
VGFALKAVKNDPAREGGMACACRHFAAPVYRARRNVGICTGKRIALRVIVSLRLPVKV